MYIIKMWKFNYYLNLEKIEKLAFNKTITKNSIIYCLKVKILNGNIVTSLI